MCELFAVNFSSEISINKDLKAFFAHSDENAHGWGLAILQNENINIEKEPIRASCSGYLNSRLEQPLLTKQAMGHIRKASSSPLTYNNTHPWMIKDNYGVYYACMHNGIISHYKPIADKIKKGSKETDSYLFFELLIDQINKKQKKLQRVLNDSERLKAIEEVIQMAASDEHGYLNLMIYCQGVLYLYACKEEQIHFLEKEEGFEFVSKPINKENFQPVPCCKVFAYKNGQLYIQGKDLDTKWDGKFYEKWNPYTENK